MKTHPLFHRTLLSFCLLVGTIAAGDAAADITAKKGATLPDRKPGLLEKIFGRKTERVKDEDDDHKLNLFGTRRPRITTVVTTKTTRSITPPSIQPRQFEQRVPNVQERTRIVMPSKSETPSPLSWTPKPRAIPQQPRALVPDSMVVVPPATQSTRVMITPPPPLSQSADPSYAPARPAQPDNTSVVVVPVTRKEAGAQGEPPALPPPPQFSPSIPPAPAPLLVPTADVPQSAIAASSPEPSQPPQVPFGKPVPGHRGLVYTPGQEEIIENMIDVKGIPPGTKVRDPVTKTIFRVP